MQLAGKFANLVRHKMIEQARQRRRQIFVGGYGVKERQAQDIKKTGVKTSLARTGVGDRNDRDLRTSDERFGMQP